MPTKENSEFVSKTTLQEMLDAQSRDMKKHFDERLAAVNDDIATLKLELKSKDNDVINLKAEIDSINELMTRGKDDDIGAGDEKIRGGGDDLTRI